MGCRNYSKTVFNKIKVVQMSGSVVNNFIHFVFIAGQVGDYQNILKLSCRPLAFTSYIAYFKNKKRSGTSLPVSFSAWFLKKDISSVIFYYLRELHCLVFFTS